MFKNKNILIFDFETTGLNSKEDEILEIGALRLEIIDGKFKPVDELEVILKTNNPISETITKITGITNEMQEEHGISQAEGFYMLDNLIDENTILVAYNIQFDLGFLKEFYIKNFDTSFEVKNDVIDVMAIYKDRHKYPHRLESAVLEYKIDEPNTHRALDDVKATYELIKKLQIEKSNLKDYINVIGYNPKYGVSGEKLKHVTYVAQYGGRREIENKKA